MYVDQKKCNKKWGHCACWHYIDGLYSNFATDEVVNT